MAALSENVGAGLPDAQRRALLARAMESAALVAENPVQHCEVGRLLATELGLPVNVATALGQAFARWNGAGVPGLSGEEIVLSMRIALLTEEAERYSRARGPKAAVEMVGRRAGQAYDPDLVEVFAAGGEEVLGSLDAGDCWSEVLDAEPEERLWLGGEAVDRALLAVADFTDMKSPFLIGHSRAVADLAAVAAAESGLPAGDVVAVRRAGWLHDIGRVAVSSAIWAKPGSLTAAEWERVRLHPHYTDRVLAGVPAWMCCGALQRCTTNASMAPDTTGAREHQRSRRGPGCSPPRTHTLPSPRPAPIVPPTLPGMRRGS